MLYAFVAIVVNRFVSLSEEKDAFFQLYSLPSWLEKRMVTEFDGWESRYDEIVATNEYKQWFFLSNYRMHSELFRTHMKTLAVEGGLLVVLLTAFITNYEFEQSAQLVIYPTKRGRKLLLNKGLASLLASFIVIAILFGVTLSAYFTVYTLLEKGGHHDNPKIPIKKAPSFMKGPK